MLAVMLMWDFNRDMVFYQATMKQGLFKGTESVKHSKTFFMLVSMNRNQRLSGKFSLLYIKLHDEDYED